MRNEDDCPASPYDSARLYPQAVLGHNNHKPSGNKFGSISSIGHSSNLSTQLPQSSFVVSELESNPGSALASPRPSHQHSPNHQSPNQRSPSYHSPSNHSPNQHSPSNHSLNMRSPSNHSPMRSNRSGHSHSTAKMSDRAFGDATDRTIQASPDRLLDINAVQESPESLRSDCTFRTGTWYKNDEMQLLSFYQNFYHKTRTSQSNRRVFDSWIKFTKTRLERRNLRRDRKVKAMIRILNFSHQCVKHTVFQVWNRSLQGSHARVLSCENTINESIDPIREDMQTARIDYFSTATFDAPNQPELPG